MPKPDPPTDWETLFGQQVPHALRLAIRLTGNIHDGEDIVQEALLKAIKSRHTYRAESSLKTWISRIVINVFRTWVSRKQQAETLSHDPVADCAAVSNPADSSAQAAVVALHVSQLPERQREVLVLCVYENMAATDVAELLGLSVQNVYSNLSAAKRNLKDSLSVLLKHGANL